jgi:predicted metalloprotease with PDZ domain
MYYLYNYLDNYFKLIVFKLIYFLSFLPLFVHNFCFADVQNLYYTLTLDKKIINVKINWNSSISKETEIYLPTDWGGVKTPYLLVNNIRILINGIPFLQLYNSNIIKFSHPPFSNLSLEYDFCPLAESKVINMPQITNDYTYFVGNVVLAYPKTKDNLMTHLKINCNGFRHTDIITSFNNTKKEQSVTAKLSSIRNSFYFCGLSEVEKIFLQDQILRIAFINQTRSNNEVKKLIHAVKKIITYQRSFFHDYNFPNYLVVFINPKNSQNVLAGLNLHNSIVNYISKNDWVDTLYVISHEHLHNWIGNKIFQLINNDNTFNENNECSTWFFEGFTDYYAWRLNYFAKVISKKSYINYCMKDFLWYQQLKQRNLSNKLICKNFWNDDKLIRIPYIRGHILAQLINMLSGENPYEMNSLDSIMQELIYNCIQHNSCAFDKKNFQLKIKNKVKSMPHNLFNDILEGENNFLNINLLEKMLTYKYIN